MHFYEIKGCALFFLHCQTEVNESNEEEQKKRETVNSKYIHINLYPPAVRQPLI